MEARSILAVRSRIIALILIFTHIGYYLPAQEAAVDLARGMARLERYLDRAAQERSAKGWEELAAAGLEAALLEWESANIYMKESEPEQWAEKREEAQWIYGLEKEAAYIEWAGQRVYAEVARGAGSALAAELKQAAAEWTYTREDGSVTRTIDMKEAGSARAAWELVAGAIIERYVEEWEGKHNAAYGELRARYEGSGLSEEELAKIYGEVSGTQRAAVYSEYARVAAAEGNDLLRVLLYDSRSMKKAAAGEAAGAIARRLAEEAKAASEQGIAKLFGELEEKVSAAEQEGIQITSEEWLASFRGALEAGLAKWDEAGYAFLAARTEWERDAEGAYWEGEDAWAEAYGKLEEAREEWQRELQAKLEQGRVEWEARHVALGEELETALKELAVILNERKENKRKLIEAQIGIYERSRELMEMAYQGIVYWYEQWGRYYEWYEEKYVELFGSQGPPGYGQISVILGQPDMGALTEEGGLARLEEQLEKWKAICVEVIKKIHEQGNEALQAEKEELESTYDAEYHRLQAERTAKEEEIAKVRIKGIYVSEEEYRSKKEVSQEEYAQMQSELAAIEAAIAELELEKAREEDEIAEKESLIAGVLALINGKEAGDIEGEELEAAVQAARSALTTPVIFSVALWNSGQQVIEGSSGWLALAQKYRKEANNAVERIYEICGIDISRIEEGALAGYGDELASELMKAAAVVKYWESELYVARAVEEYARQYNSLIESAEDTEGKLQDARDKYESELKKYEMALEKLREQGVGIDKATEQYEKHEAELEKLNEKVREAAKDYAAVMALILKVDKESVHARIGETAAALVENRSERDRQYGEYLEAVQAYEAARHLAGLRQEAEWIAAGAQNQQSIARLAEKIGKVKGITETADILEQYKAVLDTALGDEKQLLEKLKAAHGEAAAGPEKDALEAAIQAVWGAVLSYYEAEQRAAKRAVEYLYGKDNLSEPLSDGKRMEKELRAWLMGQLAGIEQEIALAEVAAEKLKQQRNKIQTLLAAASVLAAAETFREDEDIADILRRKTELGLAEQAAALVAYRAARTGLGLEAADADEWILREYGGMRTAAVNAADAKARAAVHQIIKDFSKDPWQMNITALYGYIAELRAAGAGLGLAGQTALNEYIQGLLEYAAIRDVQAQANMQINRAGAEQAYKDAVEWQGTLVGWLESLRDTEEYLERVLGSSAFGRMTAAERELVLRYGAGRLLQEIEWQEVAGGYASFKEKVGERRATGQAWAAAYLDLAWKVQEELYGQMRMILRLDAYTEAYDEYVEWFEWEDPDEAPTGAVQDAWEQAGFLLYLCGQYELYLELEAEAKKTALAEDDAAELAKLKRWFTGEDAMLSEYLEQIKDILEDENRDANWYYCYVAGPEFLYVYIMLGGVSGEALETAAGYLDAKQAEFVRTYQLVNRLARSYNPYLDGDMAAWVDRQGLDARERAKLWERMVYGFMPTGLGYFQDDELELLSGDGPALETVVMYDMRAVIDMLYGTLAGVQEGIVAAALALQYAQYAEREQEKDYRWTEEYATFYKLYEGTAGTRTPEAPAAFTAEQEAAMAKIRGDVSGRMRESLRERLRTVAALFSDYGGGAIAADSAEQMADSDYAGFMERRQGQSWQAAQEADIAYRRLAWAGESLTAELGRQLTQNRLMRENGQELEEKRVEMQLAVVAAQDEYHAYYENEYSGAILGIQAAYKEYNAAAGALNAAHEAVNTARLEVRTRQEIYDFARSVYLREQGVSEAEGYETPKEKLGRVMYAYERAKISVDVLKAIQSGSPLGNKEYSGALAEYKASAEHYYLGLAAAFEAKRTVAKQREAVAKAEAAEAAALRALVISAESYPVPYVPVPADEPGWLYTQTGISAEEFEEYFTNDKAVEREDIIRGTYTITQAEADTVEWLERINQRLKDEAEYFNDLMLAAMYMNYLYGNGNIEADDIADDDGKIKSKKEKWYQGTDPEDAGNYPLGGIAALEGGAIEEKYSDARLEELKKAYDKIDGDTEKKKDLARYLLYRDTTLAAGVGGAGAEQSVLVKRALSGAISFVTGRQNVLERDAVNLGIMAAAAAASAVLLLVVPGAGGAAAVLFAAAAVALLGSLNATDMKKKYEVAENEIIAIQAGHPSETGKKVTGLFATYLAKRNDTAAERAKLNTMLYGSAEVPAKENGLLPDLEYGDFSKALDSLMTTKELKDEAVELYSEDVFTNSGAWHYGTVTEAIEAMNRHLGNLHEAARKALDTQADKLKKAQAAAQAAYWAGVSAGQEMTAENREKLQELAADACDTTLSVAEREQAATKYDDLYEELLKNDGIRAQLTKLAKAAWETGTWNSYVHDRELVGHAAGLYGGQWMRYENAAEPYTMWAGMNLEEALLEAIERQNALEMSVEKARLELIGDDFMRQKAAWEGQMEQLRVAAAQEWEKAKGKINEGEAQWRRTFWEEYGAKTTAWEASYLEFMREQQEWVETQYIYAVTAGNAGLLVQADADVGEVIMRALEGTQVARMSRGTEEIAEYAAELFTETKETMSLLMETAEGLSGRARYGAQAVKRGKERETVTAKLAEAQQTQRELNEEMQKGAARLAAIQAGKLIEAATAAYLERIDAENRGMREWQEETVGKDRYRVEGKRISREAVVDSTVRGVTQKTQTVYAYQDFVTEGPHLRVKLDAEILSGLDPVTIMDMVDQGKRELATWGEGIFGKVGADGKLKQNQVVVPASAMTFDEYKAVAAVAARAAAAIAAVRKQTDEEKPVAATAVRMQTDEELKDEYEQEMKRLDRKERDGEMGRHIGYRAILKGKGFDLTKGREWNIEYEGSGEMGKILLDMQWNTIEAQQGWAEAAKPVYDQKLWGTDEFFIAPPTIRDITDIAMSVVSVAVVAAAGMTGVLAPLGVLIAYGINQLDDLVFATSDSAFTSKNNEEVWKAYGQQAVTSAVTSAMTLGFDSMAAGAKVALETASPLAKAMVQGGIRMTQSMVTTTVTSAITGAEYNSTSLLANALGAGVSAGLGSYLLGDTIGAPKYLNSTLNLAASAGGELAKYGVYAASNLAQGYGNDSFSKAYDDMDGLTLNLLNAASIARLIGVNGNMAQQMNVGLLEWHITKDMSLNNTGLRFGTGGIDVGSAVYDNIAINVVERIRIEIALKDADDDVKDFARKSAQKQWDHLYNIISPYNKDYEEEDYERGEQAAKLRELQKVMKLEELFNYMGDETRAYMNNDVRDFLNLNNNGSNRYDYSFINSEDGIKGGWREATSIDSQYHQTGVEGPLNAKFVNEDGREVVFSWNNGNPEQVIKDPNKNEGTYNFYNGSISDTLLFRNFSGNKPFSHNRYDVIPFNESLQFRPELQKTEKDFLTVGNTVLW
jgi:hypothetical protein